MSFVIFSTISMIVIIYFAVMPKNLNILELTMIILLAIYLDSNFLDISMLNLNTFKLSKNQVDHFSFFCTFILLFPVLIAISIDRLYSNRRGFSQCLTLLFILLTIVGLENVTRYLKVISYVNWNWRMDVIQWSTIWLICYIVHILFKKLVMKELEP